MIYLPTTLALAAILTSLSAATPLVQIQNYSNQTICYLVEYSSGAGAFPTEAACNNDQGAMIAGFWVNSGQTREFNAPGFNGAITAILSGNTIRGARHEINLAANPGQTWYDVDYEYGISDSTLGPIGGQDTEDGHNSLSGEPDAYAKANAAWVHLDPATKSELLAFPQYLAQADGGSLDWIHMDINAPVVAPAVVYFFQITADFTAYLNPGSVAGQWVDPGTSQAVAKTAADKKTWLVGTDQMVITSH